MNLMNKDEFVNKGPVMIRKLKNAVFIYPTDTIYGIGCDATDEDSVNRIREIKSRFKLPFSVIAPSIEWIEENCVLTDNARDWLDKLPGPYTLILKLKNPESVASGVTVGNETVGVRMPNNWFLDVVQKMNKPIVTTSANKLGDDFMTSVEDLNPEVGSKVDYVIHEGELQGRPSTLVFLDKADPIVKER